MVLAFAYAALLRTGVFEGGVRAYIHHSNRGETRQAEKGQNVGFSFEAVASVVPGLGLMVASFFISDEVQRIGFLLAPVAVTAASISAFLSGLRIARSEFDLVARVSLIRTIFVTPALLGAVLILGAVGVFIAPMAADLLMICMYATRRPRLDLRLDFHWSAARRFLRVGFPLGAMAIVYWVYRLIGSTSVGLAEGTRALGIYLFAAAPVAVLVRALSSVQAVLIPSLWGEMAGDHGNDRWVRAGNRITLAIAVMAGVVTNLAQAGFGPLVTIVAPKFTPAIPIFNALAFNVVLLMVASVPSIVLDSAKVNRQAHQLGIWVAALVVNAAANAIVLTLGLGSRAVAWNDIWVQLLVVVVIFALASPHLGGRHRLGLPMSLLFVAVPLIASAIVLALLPARAATLGETAAQLGLRVATVSAIWCAVGMPLVLRRRRIGHWAL